MNVAIVVMGKLKAHVGDDTAKKKSLRAFLSQRLGRNIHRQTLVKYIYGAEIPNFEKGIHILRWLQLEGVIVPQTKEVGLFSYAPAAKPGTKAKKHGKQNR